MLVTHSIIRHLAKIVPQAIGCIWLGLALSQMTVSAADDILPAAPPGGIPEATETPGTPEAPGTPDTPGTPETPETPETPAAPGVPKIPSATDALPALPALPAIPGDPNAIPVLPAELSAPSEPAAPDELTDPTDPTDPTAVSDLSDFNTPAGMFENLLGFPLDTAFGDDFRTGFSLTTTLSGTYDSNITRTPDQALAQPQDDFFLSLGSDLSYLSKASAFTFGGNYRGRYDQYCNLTEFSGYSQGGGLVANFKGSRISATATVGYDSNRGSPQNYYSNSTFGGNPRDNYNQDFNQGDFNRVNQGASLVVNYTGSKFSASANVGIDMNQGSNNYSSSTSSNSDERTNIHTALTGRYRIGQHLALVGNIGQSSTTSNGYNYGDTSSFDLGTSVMWTYSPRTEAGLGLRYTSLTRDSTSNVYQQGRTSLGPSLDFNYKLSKKVSLTSQVGMDFAKYEDGQSADPTLSGALALNYQASNLWGVNLSFVRDVETDPSIAASFYESNSLRLGYHRKIRRAAFSLGMSYRTRTSTTSQGMTGRPDASYLNFDSTLSMPVFANTCNASVFARYTDQSGMTTSNNATGNAWNSFQMGFSINRKF